MDDEQSPIGVTVEGRVIVQDVRHMRERVGQEVVLSFVRQGRPETVEFLDSPAHDSGGTTKLCVLSSRLQEEGRASHFVADGGGSGDIFAIRKPLAARATSRHNGEQHEYRCKSASHRGIHLARPIEGLRASPPVAKSNASRGRAESRE
jgi:hypothetical protein